MEKAGEVKLFGNDFAEILKQNEEKGIEEVPQEIPQEVEVVEGDSDEELIQQAIEQIEEVVPKLPEEKIKDIQTKLLTKILPVLERHLTDTKDKNNVRSFVAVSYVQAIRKLPIHNFNTCLHKIVNMIVV